ncbi:6-phosphogluconate dehydrogenase family protein [Talaromyces stipitatus ATCC 10500]|uniref:6-phosphogluconate dehydrogenase family protein n=1 Tax=Talaromyces stipitatus (strain ATCC 10500 / CBS 375.48 / QM 6759 / NRRL 1006) TaxID=441959 RepID=B8M259_TALSN|nr:6-phosphogluconate dehydrogenase family protein [Talaromyces stipitatus ATCC 10500]EED21523.1 6-phosphogluconate dehydrogenase family protein [Talaromyces stipitatus ATCC 10500]
MATQIGWYGLGSMGLAMATNLQRHLSSTQALSLLYSNRTLSRGDSLQQLGAVPQSNFKDLVSRSNIIFTMVSNDAVLESLINTAIESPGTSIASKIFIDCSTVHPQTITSISSRLSSKSASFLCAPVFGGNPVATAGKLVFALAGSTPEVRHNIIKPLIQDVMGRKVIDCGEDPAKSSLLKIAGNIVTVSLMETVGEAQVFAEKTGLGTEAMEELINEAFGPIAGGYSKRLTTGAYAPELNTRPGFGVSLAIKDANHALSIAQDKGVELPSVELARDNMASARDYAGECLDSSSMYGILRQKAGLAFWNEKSRQGGGK